MCVSVCLCVCVYCVHVCVQKYLKSRYDNSAILSYVVGDDRGASLADR